MKFIFKYVRKHWFMFFISILFLAMESVADLLQPAFMSNIVDKGIENADVKLISYYGIIMLSIACAGALFAVLRNFTSTKVSQSVGKEIRGEMYSAVQKLSLGNIDKLQAESIITRITNDVNQVQGFVMSCMRMMVKSPITCIGAISLIIIQTPKQAPVLCVILALVFVVILLNMKVSYPKFNKMQQSMDKLNGVTKEYLNSVRAVKAFTAEDEEIIKFNEASNNLKDKSISAMKTMAVFMPLINLIVNFGIIVLLYISKSDKSTQIGKLMASINYMTQVSMAMGMISNIMNSAVRAIASSNRIKEVMDEKPSQVFVENPVKIEVNGKIEFKNVSFAYGELSDVEVLKNINFMIEPGKTLGIIGPTGCGKSSLVNLVPRFYDVTKGCVLIDDVDITKVDVKLLREKIAVVPQKSLLFSGTIKNNLLWGKEDASDEEVEWACRIAQAEKFILEKEDGYQTVLSQGATNLSGGQKQRLSLARALLRKPKILILDDCTSALDASTESAVLNGLRELQDCTVLLISQRISTVIKADKILCIDEGKIQGFGSHKELLNNCETYRKIFESQIGGVENGK